MTQVIGIQRRMAELGRIRSGDKAPSGAPRALKTFRLTSASRRLLEGAAEEYGGTVEEWAGAPDEGYFELTTTSDSLDAILPPVFSDRDGSPTLPYSQAYEQWGKGGCLRRCDGQTEVLSNKPCLCNPDARDCDITTRLNVMLPKVPGFGVWRYESHGWHAATTLPGTLDVLMMAASQQRFIPAVLRIEQRSAKREGQTHRFSVVVIDLPELRVADLLDATGQPISINAPAPLPPKPELPPAPAPESEAFESDVAPFGDAPALPDPEVRELVSKLHDLGLKVEADPDFTQKSIDENASKNAGYPAKHISWLKRCCTTLEKRIADAKAAADSPFKTPATVA